MSNRLSAPGTVLLIALALAGAIFALDVLTPLGLAVWGLYLLPLFLVFEWGRPSHLYMLMAACTALIVLGLPLAPHGVPISIAGANRILGITGYWLLTYYLAQHQRREWKLRQSEEEMRVNLTKYMTIFDTAPVGISITDSTGRIVEVNRRAERLLNVPQPEHETRNLDSPEWQVVRPDGSPMPAAEYPATRALTEQRRIDDAVIGIVRSADDVAWLNVTAAPIPVPGYGVLIVYYDITERKRIREALAASEERLSRALNGSNDGWWDWQVAADMLYYSPRNWTMLGYDPSEIEEHADKWKEFMHPDDLVRFEALLAELLGSRRLEFCFEARMQHRDGHYVPILVRGNVTRDADGNAVMISGANTDLTQLKAAEDALRRLNGELEARVAARTVELAAALEKLERADRIKEEFLAAVSHELRTPLTGVLGIAEALELQVVGPLNERQLRHVRMLAQSGERLLTMIDNVLHYTNLIAGRFTPRPVTCYLPDLGSLALRSIQAEAQQKRLAVDLKVFPAGATIVTDRDALLRMLAHLLGNAVKFTPEDGAIGLEIVSHADGSAQFVVWDTGIGIPAAQQERIFEPFTQADGSLARRFEGMGLGLAYVRRMVEALGGSFLLESIPNEGSRFIITLASAGPATAAQHIAMFET